MGSYFSAIKSKSNTDVDVLYANNAEADVSNTGDSEEQADVGDSEEPVMDGSFDDTGDSDSDELEIDCTGKAVGMDGSIDGKKFDLSWYNKTCREIVLDKKDALSTIKSSRVNLDVFKKKSVKKLILPTSESFENYTVYCECSRGLLCSTNAIGYTIVFEDNSQFLVIERSHALHLEPKDHEKLFCVKCEKDIGYYQDPVYFIDKSMTRKVYIDHVENVKLRHMMFRINEMVWRNICKQKTSMKDIVSNQ